MFLVGHAFRDVTKRSPPTHSRPTVTRTLRRSKRIASRANCWRVRGSPQSHPLKTLLFRVCCA